MMNQKSIPGYKTFSWKSRGKSFVYAWAGIVHFFRTEHNARIHLAATLLVVLASVLFPVSRTEGLILFFAVVLVWITEILNTAIEKAMDLVSTEFHPSIRMVKDLAAAAVLIAAGAAVVTALFIFLPKIFNL